MHVLIIGGGLAGMTLAQSLRKQNVSFEIFERDESQYSRFQGWAMSLHWIIEPLLNACPEDMPPLDQVSHFYPHDYTSSMGFWNASTGEKAMEIAHSKEHRMIRANRAWLRTWLSTNIAIRWGKKFDRYEYSPNGKTITAFFADGTSATGDLLVAADGSRSKVRNHLVGGPAHDRLSTLPLCLLNGETTVNRAQLDVLMKNGRSAFIGAGDNKARIFVGLKNIAPDHESAIYYWSVFYNDDAAAESEKDFWTARASKQELYDKAREVTAGWDEKIMNIVRWTDASDMIQPPMVLRDLIPRESPKGRVFLMGDAAHALTPFQGEGGNHAMLDAVKLGAILGKFAAGEFGVEKALAEYEAEMIPRTKESVERSRTAGLSENWLKLWAQARGQQNIFLGGTKKADPEVERNALNDQPQDIKVV